VATVYGWPVLQPTAKTAMPLDHVTLSSFIGEYRAQVGSDHVALNVRLDGGRLIARSSFDGLDATLYAETPTRFFTLEGNTFVFARDASGRVTSVETGGNTYTRRP